MLAPFRENSLTGLEELTNGTCLPRRRRGESLL